MRFYTLIASLGLMVAACQKTPPRRVVATELIGTYKAQTKVVGQERVGTIQINADGTYVHEYVVAGVRREQTGTWKAVQSGNDISVRFAGFVADWIAPTPTAWQAPVQAYGERVSLDAVSDEGFYFVKQEAGGMR